VHDLYKAEAVPPVEAVFPGVTTDGAIDRQKLSAILIAHPERLRSLEAIVHPLVRARIDRFLEEAATAGARLAVVDIPLLFERGVDWGLDAVAVTVVDEAEQRRRALTRPGMTVEKLDAILARQMPQAEKRARADYILDTGTSIDSTRAEVAALVGKLTGSQNAR
jgi:dephospho-CoA kinase